MLNAGEKILDCEIVRQLAENNVYQSYFVRCADAAAKLILIGKEQVFAPTDHRQFLDQAHWLAGHTFPGIAIPIRAGEYEGGRFCLYPPDQGIPLDEVLTAADPLGFRVGLLKTVLECLVVPHSAGLVHGNLSPATIRFSDGAASLADFALSQLVKLDYQSGVDPHFISPEQVRGEAPQPASDIYNLGCVLHYLLTGEAPFSGTDAFAVALKHVQGDFPVLPEPLQLLQPLLAGMTCGSAAERPSAPAVLEALAAILSRNGVDDIALPGTAVREQSRSPIAGGNVPDVDDGTEAESDFSARIEARLRDQAAEIKETIDALAAYPGDDGFEDTTAGLEQVDAPEESHLWRYVLLLLIGVLIGSGSYFFFFDQQQPEPQPQLQQEVVSDPDEMLDRALLLWQEGDPARAAAGLKALAAEFPADPRPLNNLAVIAAGNGNYDQARKLLERALATNIDYATVYNNLGAVYTEMARDSYGKALQLDRKQTPLRLSAMSSRGVTDMPGADDGIVTADAGPVAAPPEEEEPVAVEPTEDTVDGTAVVGAGESGEIRSDADAVEVAAAVPAPETVPAPEMTAAAAPAPEVGATEDSRVEVASGETPEAFIERWARAWSEQDVEAYLTFYAETFIPPAGRSREDWEQLRRERISRPRSINLGLSEITSSATDDNSVRLNVVQAYQSDVYSDRTRKVFDLRRQDNNWKIVRERSLGAVR